VDVRPKIKKEAGAVRMAKFKFFIAVLWLAPSWGKHKMGRKGEGAMKGKKKSFGGVEKRWPA